jgi:hypothetical protein
MFFLAQTTPLPKAVSGSEVVVIIAAVIVLAGLVVILGRYVLDPSVLRARAAAKNISSGLDKSGDTNNASNRDSSSLIRSWIAISLVSGLLICCGVAFSLSDDTIGSTLFGGLVASTGSAIAFYFSSKSSDQARQDVIAASQSASQVVVPTLVHMLVTDAQVEMSKMPLQLVIAPTAPGAVAGTTVVTQSPVAGSKVPSGTLVTVTT